MSITYACLGLVGYASTAANGLQKKLLGSQMGWNVHSRVLGNVLYLMASQTSDRKTLGAIEELLSRALLK
jgi:dethiobiotin synthetase/adenosylmethionine--8-amino-7-oxononanoate aminotransferase